MRLPAAIFLSATTVASASAQSLTTARTDYQTTAAPRAVVVADFNGDGWPDIASAGTGASSVSVLLNTGRGGADFRPAPDILVGGGPFDMAAGDIDRDGVVDLAIANADLNAVTLLIGRGDGSFRPKRDTAVPGSPRGIALADVNGDGLMDIVVSQYAASSWRILYGNGNGGFGSVRTVPTHSQPQGVAIADVNHDGRLDVVVAHAGWRALSVFSQSGSGTWTRQDAGVRGPFNVLATGDFNRDGWSDVAAASTAQSLVALYTGGGSGLSEACAVAVGQSPRGLAVGDLNQDGVPDLVTGDRGSSTLSVLPGRAAAPCPLAEPAEIVAGRGARTVAVADLDRDGRPDLVSANEYGHSVSTLLNTTTFVRAGFALARAGLIPPHEDEFEPITVADFDRSGRLDVAVIEKRAFSGMRLLLDGARTVNVPSPGANDLASADVDNDGNVDIIVSNNWPVGELRVHLGDGHGNFRALSPPAAAQAVNSTFADFNRDGRLDLVSPQVIGSTQTATMQVLAGRGDGTFAPLTGGTMPAVPAASAFTAADVDRDGRQDLVMGHLDGVTVLFGDGAGFWTHAATYHVQDQDLSITSLAVADVNEDGRPDLIAAGGPSTTVVVLLALPDGSFAAPTEHPASLQPFGFQINSLGIGDIDLDGHLDVVADCGGILFGNGEGAFALREFEFVGSRVTVADYNRDGLPDMILAAPGGASTVVLNQRREGNRNPIANAGPDLTVPYRDDFEVELEAAPLSYDPDLHRLTYQWRDEQGVVFSGPIFEVPRVLPGGRHTVTLTAFDGRGGQGSDTVAITVPPLPEIVIHAADSETVASAGAWRRVEDATAAGGGRLQYPNAGGPKLPAPLAEPGNYVVAQFIADPRLDYKLWIRGKAENDYWGNDSIFVQFQGATDPSGAPRYEAGTTTALTVNLEECSGCGLRGWGWEDDGWGAKDRNGGLLRFTESRGAIVIQIREDGISIDQIVLSAEKFLTARPGPAKDDHTILPSTIKP